MSILDKIKEAKMRAVDDILREREAAAYKAVQEAKERDEAYRAGAVAIFESLPERFYKHVRQSLQDSPPTSMSASVRSWVVIYNPQPHEYRTTQERGHTNVFVNTGTCLDYLCKLLVENQIEYELHWESGVKVSPSSATMGPSYAVVRVRA